MPGLALVQFASEFQGHSLSAQFNIRSSEQSQAPRFDPRRENVAASGYFSQRIGQVLSSLFGDELELAGGVDVRRRMLADPEVLKGLMVLKDGILGDGVQLFSFYTDEKTDQQRAADSALYQEFCRFNLFETPLRPFNETLNEAVFEALQHGHKPVEQTYRDWMDETGAPRLVIDKLKCKPLDAVQFVVDEFMNVLGLQVWQNGKQFIIPRDKFFIPTFDRKDEDPRGRTLSLRAAYNWWNAKRAGLPIYLKWMEKKAIPSTVGFTSDKEQELVQEYGENGQPLYNGSEPVVRSSAEVMASKLAELENASCAAFPHGAKVEALSAGSDNSQFSRFFQLCDQQITRAILLQDLATNEGKFGTRAQASTHMDVLALRVWHLKNIVAEAIRTDILKPLLYYNFGPEAGELTPAVSLGDTERKDWATDAQAAAVIGPLVPDSVWAAICAQLGLPQPEEGEDWPSRGRQSAPTGTEGDAGQTEDGDAEMTVSESLALHASLASAMRAARRIRSIVGGGR